MTDWISADEASQLLLTPKSQLQKFTKYGHLSTTRKVPQGGFPDRQEYDRGEVTALAAARRESGAQPADILSIPLPPSAITAMHYVATMGNEVTGDNVATLIADAIDIARATVNASLVDMAVLGLVERTVESKRTKRVALTVTGQRWLAVNADEVALYGTAPKPEPVEDVAEPADESTDLVHVAVEAFPRTEVEPPPAVEPNPFASTDPGAIAGALLRQVVRQLTDTEGAALIAERDALRAHNESLVARLDRLTGERDRAEAENRELRRVLHDIEQQLAPLMGGRDSRFDWLDAGTRTDLMRAMSEVAAWAAAS